MKVLLIGGVAGGATAAGRLRRVDEQAEIIMFERGPYISFANCGLPYYVGGEIPEQNQLLLETPEGFLKRYNIEVRVWNEVISIQRDSKTVQVKNHATGEEYTESYDKLLISTGAEPVGLGFPGADLEGVFTLRTVPDAVEIREYIEQKKAKTAIIVGGGYIGLEMVENLAAHNIAITLVERGSHVVGSLDEDMAGEVHQYLKDKGITLLLNHSMTKITADEQRLAFHCDERAQPLFADMIILALGVNPESPLAEQAGLTLGVKKSIVVDKYMRTSDPSIYAVGDVVQVTHAVSGMAAHIPLAGPANKQARIAADNIAGGEMVYRGSQGSSILKLFDMTIATTGLGLAAATKAGLEADSVIVYEIDHAGYYPGAEGIALKVIYEKNTGIILGAQCTGFGSVDKRCDVLATAIRGRMTAMDLTDLDLCYAPPYGIPRDAVNLAGYIIENARAGMVSLYRWDQVDDLQKNDGITLLDVRHPDEIKEHSKERYLNIPLPELRDRMAEIPKTKPVYISCGLGMRSYIAGRILAGHGYETYSLCGGWRLYRSTEDLRKNNG